MLRLLTLQPAHGILASANELFTIVKVDRWRLHEAHRYCLGESPAPILASLLAPPGLIRLRVALGITRLSRRDELLCLPGQNRTVSFYEAFFGPALVDTMILLGTTPSQVSHQTLVVPHSAPPGHWHRSLEAVRQSGRRPGASGARDVLCRRVLGGRATVKLRISR